MSDRIVHLVPTGTAYIPGVPAVECDVDEETAADLLAYSPPAFTVAKRPARTPAPETPSADTPTDPTTPEV